MLSEITFSKLPSALRHASAHPRPRRFSSRWRRPPTRQRSPRRLPTALSTAVTSPPSASASMAVMLQFPLGDVVVDLYDEGEPAKICESFTRLCARKYYHGCLVYQVQSGCLAQTGDPSGTGKGGCCSQHDEDASTPRFIRHAPSEDRQKHDRAGLVSVVSMGSQGNEHVYGSQFFFTL